MIYGSKDQSKHTGILLWHGEGIIPFPVYHPTQGPYKYQGLPALFAAHGKKKNNDNHP